MLGKLLSVLHYEVNILTMFVFKTYKWNDNDNIPYEYQLQVKSNLLQQVLFFIYYKTGMVAKMSTGRDMTK